MKKLSILLLLVATTIGSSSFKLESNVYHCDSKDAKKYHLTKTCRGLNACKHEIRLITLADAKAKGLTICGWED